VSSSTQQFRRDCEVVIGAGGHGTAIRDLRIQFEVTKDVYRTPNPAQILLTNLSPNNENKLRTEYKDVLVNAGYVGASLLTFRGNIRHAFRYRDGNDWVSQIDAADGDKDFRNSIINRTLAAGTTEKDLLDIIVESFTDTKLGDVTFENITRGRGRMVSGMARDILDHFAMTHGAHWSIQDGNLQIVRVDSTLATEAIVLRSDTGLLGAPEINDKGIKVKCLLNPRIRCNGKIKLDNNDLKELIHKEKVQKPGAPHHSTAPVRLDPDGIYKVFKLVHKGDTRGPDWYTEAHCVGLKSPIPSQAGSRP